MVYCGHCQLCQFNSFSRPAQHRERKVNIELEREAGEKEDMQEYIASKLAAAAAAVKRLPNALCTDQVSRRLERVEIMSKIVKVLKISNSQAVGEEIEHSNLERLYVKWHEIGRDLLRSCKLHYFYPKVGMWGSREEEDAEEHAAYRAACLRSGRRSVHFDTFAQFITFLNCLFDKFGYTKLKRRTDRCNYIVISTRPCEVAVRRQRLALIQKAAAIDWECLAANDKISKQYVPVLKEFLRSRKLKVSGRKAELVARIKAECRRQLAWSVLIRGWVVQSRTRAITDELMSVVWQYGSPMMRYEMGDRFI